MSEAANPLRAIPAAIASLIGDGKLSAAEQPLLRLLPSRPEAERAILALEMAEVWAAASDSAQARRWLARVPPEAANVDTLRAARRAVRVADPLMAHEWFEAAGVAGSGAVARVGRGKPERRVTSGMMVAVGARRSVQPRQFNGNQGGDGLDGPTLT